MLISAMAEDLLFFFNLYFFPVVMLFYDAFTPLYIS